MLSKLLRQSCRSFAFRKQSLFACSRRLKMQKVSASALSEKQRVEEELTREIIDCGSQFRMICISSALLKCGVFDALSEDVAVSSSALAAQCEANEEMVSRMLGFASICGFAQQSADGLWSHSPKSLALCSNPSLRGELMIYASPLYNTPYIEALATLRTGVDVFRLQMGGPVFEYLSQRPQLSKTWNEYMRGMHYPIILSYIAEAVDWSQFRCVADVGGGLGHVLSAIIAKHQTVEGVLFDRAEVIDEAKDFWKQQSATVRLLAGDFYDAKDTAQLSADCAVLKFTFSDQREADALCVLRNLRAALRCGNSLMIIEPGFVEDTDNALVKEFDVHMALFTGGKLRSIAAMDSLFAATGFKRTNVFKDDNVPTVIVQAQAID